MDLYDGMHDIENKGLIFTDTNHANFLFKNSTIKFTDFDANLYRRDPDARHNIMFFLEIIHWRLFKQTHYRKELRELFADLRLQLIDFLKDESVQDNRNKFLSGMKNIITEYNVALCRDTGVNENKCREQFRFFEKITKPSTPISLTFLSSAITFILMQILRNKIKALARNKFGITKHIDSALNISLLAVLCSLSQNYTISSLLLFSESLSLTGLIPQTINNYITPIVGIAGTTLNSLLTDGGATAANDLQRLGISMLGATVGAGIYSFASKGLGETNYEDFSKTASCTIL